MMSQLLHWINQSPAQQIGEALEGRGYLLEVKEDQIILSPGNGEKDRQELQSLFRKRGIPVHIHGWTMQVLAPHVPLSFLSRCFTHPRRMGHYYIPYGFHTWKGFTRRTYGLRWNTAELDPGIALLVKAMSEAGVLVTGGCDGHRKRPPRINMASQWAALWWDNIFKNRIDDKDLLHYHWEMKYSTNHHPVFTAIKKDHEDWNLMKVQHDTVKIAKQIREQASQLRSERKNIFKYKSMKKVIKRIQGDIQPMREWFETQLTAGGK